MKEAFKKRIFALIIGVVFCLLFHEELSWPGEDAAETEIKKIMALIKGCNSQMSEDLRYLIAREIYWTAVRNSNLDPPLLCALINHESAKTWDPKVVSQAGAVGLMQILPSTAREVLISSFLMEEDENKVDLSESFLHQILSDPIMNIRIGSRYLSSLIDRNGLTQGLVAYYVGESRMKGLLRKTGGTLPAGVKKYLSCIFEFYWELSQTVYSS